VLNDRPPLRPLFSCPTCAARSEGKYCSNCGEKRITDADYSIRYYLGESFSAITLLESKLLRSLWLVASKPGYLSREYFAGRRVRYIKPLQLFIFLNVVYYFSLTVFTATTFTTPLATQLHMNDYYPGYASRRVDHKLQAEKISYSALERKYNEKTAVLSKTLIFLLIPIFALLFFMFFFRHKEFFVEHLVVGTHFWAFSLLLLGVILPAVSLLLIRAFTAANISPAFVTNDGIATAVLQGCFAIYLYFMFRRAYHASIWYSTLVAATIAWSFFHIVWLYRYFLFEVTIRVV